MECFVDFDDIYYSLIFSIPHIPLFNLKKLIIMAKYKYSFLKKLLTKTIQDSQDSQDNQECSNEINQ